MICDLLSLALLATYAVVGIHVAAHLYRFVKG